MAPSQNEHRRRSFDAPARTARETLATRRLLRAARRGNRDAREQLARSHLALVRSVAARYMGLGLPFDDLVQEGAVGLLESIDRYTPSRGTAFETYARFRVRRAIRNALTDQARLIRLPKQMVERRRALDRAEAELSAAGGRAPTAAELSAATGMSVDAVREAQSVGLKPISLDQPLLPDGSPLESIIADDSATQPEVEALARERAELLNNALQKLPERHRRIVSDRWGLTAEPRSNAEVASDLALSPRRTQSIGRDALYMLRDELTATSKCSGMFLERVRARRVLTGLRTRPHHDAWLP